MRSTHRPLPATLAVLAAAAFAVGGCGDSARSDTGPPQAAATKKASLAAQVPAGVRSKGTLVVATDPTYPPNEFVAGDGRTIVGMDPDLIAALGGSLGLRVKVVNAPFDSILPGLASGKYDVGMASFTDTKEREKTVDFVTYFSAGTSFFVAADGPAIGTLPDICGHKVALEKGTVQVDDANAQAKKCKAAGKPAPAVLTFPDQNGANLALTSGRADVGMGDSPVAAWIVKKSGGRLKLVGNPYGTAPYGIAVPKGSGLTQPLLAAVKLALSDGSYGSIMRKWGLESGAIHDPAINAGS
jgi:polar amino acid transport system substrate-binding protein